MIQEDTLLKIIQYASKAPSGHNTQPWFFKTGSNSISILPDFKRALPVVDSDNHSLYISLGCALENLMLAAQYYGYDASYRILQVNREASILVNLTKRNTVGISDLFDCINSRQVTRNKYSTQKIEPAVLEELFRNILEDGVKLKLFLDTEEIEMLRPYIIEASNIQFENRAFVEELVSWMRFSEKEVLLKGDGIWTASMGLPNMGRSLGSVVMKYFVSPESEAKRWNKIVTHSAGFALFMTDKNEPEQWIKLGLTFQRFGLNATKYLISHAHVNMPCEELVVREKLILDFHLKNLTPLLLIRFGYSSPMPFSFRRRREEILLK